MGRLIKWIVYAILTCVLLSVIAVVTLRWVNPATSAFMLENRLTALSEGDRTYRTDYEWVDLEKISPHAAIAVVASEDQQFPFHAGFDFNSIRESVRASEQGKKKKMRGASTISQQVAKNLFLWNGYSFVRKGLEAWFTVVMEATWPTERILEVYLNIAEFGPGGQFGVEAGSAYAFGKSAEDLSPREAALLASILPNPAKRSAKNPGPGVRRLAATYLARGQASSLATCWRENR